MVDTLVAIAIVIAAAALLGRSVFRAVYRARGGCVWADGCPLSRRCDPQADDCVQGDDDTTPAHPPGGA